MKKKTKNHTLKKQIEDQIIALGEEEPVTKKVNLQMTVKHYKINLKKLKKLN